MDIFGSGFIGNGAKECVFLDTRISFVTQLIPQKCLTLLMSISRRIGKTVTPRRK